MSDHTFNRDTVDLVRRIVRTSEDNQYRDTHTATDWLSSNRIFTSIVLNC